MRVAALLALLAVLALPAHADEAAAALAAVTDLGRINGSALACGEKIVSAQAKNLMLLHAPRTPRFGAAFEQATQQGFLAQVKEQTACPDADTFAQDIDRIAAELRAQLPANAAP